VSNTVGIIGAGNIGQAIAKIAVRAGRQVVIANSRGPESLTDVVAALGDGASAGTFDDAAAAPIVVLAVPWDRVGDAVAGRSWDGRIVVDTTNPLKLTITDGVPEVSMIDVGGRVTTEIVAEQLPGARVVKAGNTLPAARLGEDPSQEGGRRIIFVSGDDDEAKAAVASLFDDAGFRAIDLGDVAASRLQQVPDGVFPGRTFVEVGEAGE
jgi:predicted dinucleotide-binding enzyme